MRCVICNTYFKQHSFNRTKQCDDCLGADGSSNYIDSETEVDINSVLNPSGKVQPVFYPESASDMDSD
jgi:hypothetical protein